MYIYLIRISERKDKWLVQCPSLWIPFQTGKTMARLGFLQVQQQKNPYSFWLYTNVLLMTRLTTSGICFPETEESCRECISFK